MRKPAAERVRHELKFRLATVVSNQRLTPRMARVTVSHDSFAEFPSLSYDDHAKLFFAPKGAALVMPTVGPNGVAWPEGAPRPEGRDYTPRAFSRTRREVVFDFVLHQGGIASGWAEAAQPGDPLAVGGPRGSFVVRNDLDFYVLIGDETALPAIGRRIEELPAGKKVVALVEIADGGERQAFNTEAELELTWVERATGASLLEAVRAANLPAGEGYVFIAGEAAASAALREHFVSERGHDAELLKAAGYWRRGEPDFDDGHAH